MTAQLLDGKTLAEKIQAELREKIRHLSRAPGLAVILVGQDTASTIYVHKKSEACKEIGIHSVSFNLAEDVSEKELLLLIDQLNNDAVIDGILVQLPLPKHINTQHVIERIAPHKDIDGFHPYNLGRLAQGAPLLRPCTPYGIMHLLHATKIDLQGMHAVVVGASNIVGKPMALELLTAQCTVTLCHSKTKNLAQHIKAADILVSAMGKTNVIQRDWIKNQAIVIDVGIHRTQNNKLCGDIEFDSAKEKASWITPVPGGVGPMTVAMLLSNTVFAATAFHGVTSL